MIKIYSIFANWTQKEANYLNSLKLSRKIEKGYFGFSVEEDDTYFQIIEKFSKKNSFFENSKPKEFSCELANVVFSTTEIESSENFVLMTCASPEGFPQPEDGSYNYITFKSECADYHVNKRQVSPFRIKKKTWKKNQLAFSLIGEPDYMFLKKDFFYAVLEPLGLKCREVLIHNDNSISENVVQLVIPEAESYLPLTGSKYDIHDEIDSCNMKQYAVQTLDFFPEFTKKFNFHICKTKEEFYGGRKRVIISKEFALLLQKHHIISLNNNFLIPMK